MVEKLKDLYENLDIDYNKVQLYFKNCTEIKDWYYDQLLEIYELSAKLSTFTEIEECHGIHKFEYYTDNSIDKLNLFTDNLNQLLKEYGNLDNNYNSSKLIN